MNNSFEQILILFYFPQFKSQCNSRFESFFQSIKNYNVLPEKDDTYRSKKIYPEKIIRNEDKRTSLFIQGLPTDLSKKDIRNLLEKYGNINYLYVTKNKNYKEKNNSVAYLNVINYRTIIPLFMNLKNLSINIDGKIYTIKIMYSAAQGKKQLKQYIKRSFFCKYLE